MPLPAVYLEITQHFVTFFKGFAGTHLYTKKTIPHNAETRPKLKLLTESFDHVLAAITVSAKQYP